MAEKLSRKQRFQELRDEIEKEALATQVETNKPIKLSRVQSDRLSHANKPTYPHEDIVQVQPESTSQVMDELLGEVKQYNITNGNRLADDTQINILKQLDSSSPNARNQHIMPMVEEEEDLGSTMEMPRTNSFGNDVDGTMTYMPNQKLTRQNPVTQPEPEIFDGFSSKDETGEIEFDDYFMAKGDHIVLNNSDIRADDIGDTDHLDLFAPGSKPGELNLVPNAKMIDEDEEEEEKPVIFKKKPKVKKAKKKKAKKEKPVEKKKEETEEKQEEVIEKVEVEKEEKTSKSGLILNIILGVLIVALIASIGFTIYFLWQMGK